MKLIPAISFFLLLFFDATAQRTIKGRVVNDVTGVPIAGSSVFISSTSKGTVTDNAGNFELNDIPSGKHDLVISCIGYETNVYTFSGEQLPLKLKVELTVKVKELQNVTIEQYEEGGWERWGKTFMDYFVGTSENATLCKIKNEKAIRFRYYKKSNRLQAYADKPILLENKALGYMVHYQLEEFEINFREQSFIYLGYTYFEEMTNLRKGLQNRWKMNRDIAYKGSIPHFMKSLYDNKLQENGFDVRRLTRTPNLEKQRVREVYKPARFTQVFSNMTVSVGNDSSSSHPPDSLVYYRKILQEKDFTEALGTNLLTADSLIAKTEGEYKILYFDQFLYIVYKNEDEEAAYNRVTFSTKRIFQHSYVSLLNDMYIVIDKGGNYFNPKDFSTSSYWSWSEKMANLVPVDYAPIEK